MKRVLAIDPGTAKCGVAVVEQHEGEAPVILWKAIAPTIELKRFVEEARQRFAPGQIVIGRGTGSKRLIQQLQTSFSLTIVDETDTTLLARQRYWQAVPRKGWRKWFPTSLQSPPEPLDDWVAVILAERALLGDEGSGEKQ